MKTFVVLLALGLIATASSAVAQDLGPPPAPELLVAPAHQPQEGVRLAPMSEQFQPIQIEKKPLTLVNYAAMQRASERRARLDAQAWYGVSNARPTVSVTPFTGDYVWPYAGYQWAPYQYPMAYNSPTIIYAPR